MLSNIRQNMGTWSLPLIKKIYIDSDHVVCVIPFRNVSTAVMLDNGHTVFVEQDVYDVLDAIALEKEQRNQKPCSSSENK